MQDIIFVAVVVAFFALAAGYVRLCDRIVGPDPTDDGDPDAQTATSADATEPAEVTA